MNESTPPRPNSPEGRDVASVIHPLTNLKTHLDKGPVVIEVNASPSLVHISRLGHREEAVAAEMRVVEAILGE